MARRFWPNESPIGKRIASRGQGEPHWQEIVGRGERRAIPRQPRRSGYTPAGLLSVRTGTTSICRHRMRTTRKPETAASAVRRAVAEIDPDQPVMKLDGTRNIVDRNLANLGLVGTLLGAFAVLGTRAGRRRHIWRHLEPRRPAHGEIGIAWPWAR